MKMVISKYGGTSSGPSLIIYIGPISKCCNHSHYNQAQPGLRLVLEYRPVYVSASWTVKLGLNTKVLNAHAILGALDAL